MSDLVRRASQLLERARWKDEGWDKPTPPEILRKWAEESDFHAVHMSEIGPGGEIASPNDPDTDEEPPARDVGGFKAGVNPRTDFNTPVGVYGYPLNPDTYNRWFSGKSRPPFAERREWMYLLEAPESDTLHIRENGGTEYLMDDVHAFAADITAGEPRMVREAIREWEQLPDPLVDTSLDLIDGNPEAIRETPFMERVERYARINSAFGKLWNFTRIVAKRGGNGPSTWTSLLREYLYSDVIADHGSTIVHEAEPTQCVLLEPTGYEVVDVVPNVWEWKDRKKRNRIKGVVRDAMAEHGIEGLAGKFRWIGDTDSTDILENAVDQLARRPWLVDVLQDADSSEEMLQLFDKPTIKVEGGRIVLRGMRIEGWDFPVALADDEFFEFENCIFDECSAGADYASAKPFNRAPAARCGFINGTLRATEGQIDEGIEENNLFGLPQDVINDMQEYADRGELDRARRKTKIIGVFQHVWGVFPPLMQDFNALEGTEIEVV